MKLRVPRTRAPSPRLLLVGPLAVAGAFACVIQGRTPAVPQDQAISTTVHMADWLDGSAADIRSGQLGLIDDPDGPRLVVYRLTDLPQPAFAEAVRSEAPAFTENSFIVAEFDAGVRNELRGFFSSFEQAPSRARVALADAPDGRRGLHVSYEREERGFCGAWIHFFDLTSPPHERVYLDATDLTTLSFWVRGSSGGERVLLKLADEEWERIGDALTLGEVGDYVPSGSVETRWQQAVVPLSDLPARIDRSTMASLVLEGIAPAEGDIFVSRLALSRSPDPLPALPEPVTGTAAGDGASTATWIWNTADLIDRPAMQDTLLGFLTRQGIDVAFVQLVSAPGVQLRPGEVDPDPRIRPLVAGLRSNGIRVYALDGSREFALPEYHGGVFNTIRNVISYNESSAPPERFDGIRYDIEPYLLPGFHGPRRAEIVRGYLEVLSRGAELARRGGLLFGADIPFWFDAPDEEMFERVTAVVDGVVKPVSEHVIDAVDDIAIMAYRTTAYGADGIIRHSEGELRYAEAQNKPVYVALETGVLPDETLIDFRGRGVLGGPDGPAEAGSVGLTLVGDSVRMTLVPPGSPDSFATGEQQSGGADEDTWWWPVTRRVFVPGSKLSFATLGADPLRQAMRETTRELSMYESFAGFAIHYSESYARLLHDD